MDGGSGSGHHLLMTDSEATVVAFPRPVHGAVFTDARGDGRALRVSWHSEDEVVVLSFWRGRRCTSTFRLSAEQIPDLLKSLAEGPVRDR